MDCNDIAFRSLRKDKNMPPIGNVDGFLSQEPSTNCVEVLQGMKRQSDRNLSPVTSLTARNWLVGYYIVEFEQHGEDRAKYGEKLINRLSERINQRGFEPRRLREFRQLYLVYPVLGIEVAKYIKVNQPQLLESDASSIWRSAPAKLQSYENQAGEKRRSETAELEEWHTPPERLFYRLNYTILSYLATIQDPLKRAFYEQETIRGCWTTRELDRFLLIDDEVYHIGASIKDLGKRWFAIMKMQETKADEIIGRLQRDL